jgi:multidrug efflux pump subunit AcrA (membrane-fusion protein)
MKYLNAIFLALFTGFVLSCDSSQESIYPKRESISESVYASGLIKAQNQYQAFANANGIVQEIFVSEGDSVKIGSPILIIYNETARLNRENAELTRAFADRKENQSRLRDLENSINNAENKWLNDSLLYERQKRLKEQGVGATVDLEQRQLAFENSRNAFQSAKLIYQDVKREIEYNEKSASKNLSISKALESDLILKSEVDGRVYDLLKEKGEMVNSQTPLAVLGSSDQFILEMQVDEYDIVKVKLEQKVIVTMDSYRGATFEAKITKINPLMNEASKSFLVEGIFVNAPPVLYPNLTLEANIVIDVKEDALILPMSYILNDTHVINKSGDTLAVKLGLKDLQKAEILEGIDEQTEVIKPAK